MATPPLQPPALNPLRRPLVRMFLVTVICTLSYFLGSYSYTNSTTYSAASFSPSSLLQDHPPNCLQLNFTTHNHFSPPLHFEPHHTLTLPREPRQNLQLFSFCAKNFTEYCPCQDPSRERQFGIERRFHKERHCPGSPERLRCLVPRPAGYRRPFPWPKSRDYAWFKNVPFPGLTEYKKSQNWVRLQGDRFVFPGGGTSFPKGVKGYVDEIKQVVPLKSGNIRTVLDIGCGVASFGASLVDYNILTMSIAPRDIHEAQVQFALERGLPAMLGVLSTYRLPFPSRTFDMAHCSRCLVPWTGDDGLYLMEMDRILRPGGYWVLSGPPIKWRVNYKGWERPAKDLENEQTSLEDLARRLCWKKIAERGSIAVWRKPTNHVHCIQKLKAWKSLQFCSTPDSDAGWYTKMDPCISPLPQVKDVYDISGGALEKWPKRLNAAPPRITSETRDGITVRTFNEDNQLWRRRVSYYGIILESLTNGKFRNIMDMNAGFGGFAAALAKYPVWVMNVIPFDAKNNTLGIVYERGLIGTYMNWCEAFSTYPRTYDLIHANGVFSMYMDKCDILDILLEMHRILRPEGAVIIRDHVDILVKVKGITDRMRWNAKILHSEKGPFHPEKILLLDNSE
ncbi:probable methyltransferase PMT19 isoform X1 [Alnus glutinosa]|uniref:probable methyltransferase PMT19 isoform X1 n=1 Tax=Alnus glutinosa TaxID=3517 RepID=UPI002D77A059|nr:probable methyltransferase PMT19 isoform X1 [Alnus glutinosa]